MITTILPNLFSIVGCFVAVGLTVSIIAAAFGYFLECRAKSRWQEDQRLAREARRDLGAQFTSLCHWFTEDVGAWKAIEVVGAEIQRTGSFNVDSCRGLWRAEMKKMSAEKPKITQGA